ncbi:hypothetical protein K503DRAFT_64934 [Rhizopogon vinicolor AM-OR11-026]|uniref:Uncharacterized protein n=1 Tax=Rhizopogon vinicolor AM-OR11-026 TaxID=1314800 RepID=A0A1B7NFR3_9AGAM|nr:hypothetical protein K503DRAFT_64934 [Rhizopogon vinicolor AM-OR11-026]
MESSESSLSSGYSETTLVTGQVQVHLFTDFQSKICDLIDHRPTKSVHLALMQMCRDSLIPYQKSPCNGNVCDAQFGCLTCTGILSSSLNTLDIHLRPSVYTISHVRRGRLFDRFMWRLLCRIHECSTNLVQYKFVLHTILFGSLKCCGGSQGCCGSCCQGSLDEDNFDEQLKRETERTKATSQPVETQPGPSDNMTART